ncbi:MAG: bifunctional salicylyl-CoA 5-hydroxylase/oxidoreductase [Vicinamibacteria bacterium]
MNIACIGGGAGGLYFAISAKLRNPGHEIDVYERNRPDDTFGWGVVFSDQTLGKLKENDPVSAERIFGAFHHWDDIDIHFKGECIRTSGHGFAGLSRKRMLQLLQERAKELGVRLHFQVEIDGIEDVGPRDLIVASDGVNSKIRKELERHFEPDIDVRANKFIWLGTHKILDAFTFIFEETERGWVQVHAYRFDENTSTFIIECTEETWRGLGIDRMTKEESNRFCEKLFARYLDGHELMDNAAHVRGSAWLNFPRVSNRRWHHGNVVLLGDSAHTAHFSIGSGTKLALEDAIELASRIEERSSLEEALVTYEANRRVEVLRLQSAARNSTEWFENVDRYASFEPQQFAYSLLTRSQRVSHENLRARDPKWIEEFETWFAGRPGVPPMFSPFRLRGLELSNRVVVSPMCMYSAEDGTPSDFHLVHLGSRAMGGASLIYTEMTDVARDARISPGCAGMYLPEHRTAWKRVVDYVHRFTPAKIAMQLGHAGPKGSTKLEWEGANEPLEEGNWPIIGPSPVSYSPKNQAPRPMERGDMDRVIAEFVRATRMAHEAGFDLLEIHAAHGYLLSAFITPLLNQRRDAYGGSLPNRLRFPLEVIAACRAAWPSEKPLSVRISATDWVEGGVDGAEAVEIARALKAAGVDIINVSAGQTSPEARPIYGRMFQTPLSDRIRNEASIPTLAVGNIFDPDHVNGIIAAGRADLCCLARPHLADPYWTFHAAIAQQVDLPWPNQYLAGKEQLERNRNRPAGMVIDI